MINKHIRFLKLAKEISLKSNGMRRQFGAVIVDGKKILSMGYNKLSHTKVPAITSQNGERRYWGLHAEVNALLKCDFDVAGATVYIWGQNRNTGNLVCSIPCDLCRKVLSDRGIRRAIWKAKDGELVQLDF